VGLWRFETHAGLPPKNQKKERRKKKKKKKKKKTRVVLYRVCEREGTRS
jgi:hypothetical protein